MTQLLDQALIAKSKYQLGMLTKEEAAEKAKPFIDAYNAHSQKVAAKYNQKPENLTFNQLVNTFISFGG
ncbi:hypothetical protein [Priestia aryabhattai]|uniref:hypothetical protein n=1 Tax=Priestia aryabhattai TaxID=412384 RepID=UPI002E1F951C|nr:hypothetical protein [Priestia aryabhattai]